MREWDSGKDLEGKVKEILSQSNFSFKQEPYLTNFGLRADFLVSFENRDIVIEVSQRNSNEDIQRLCLRAQIYRDNLFKTLIIIPEINLTPQSLRKIQFLLKFSDAFLFVKDLNSLPVFLKDPTYGAFFKYISTKLSMIYPEVSKIFKFLQENKRIYSTLKEISEGTNVPRTRVRSLLHGLNLNLTKIGLLEVSGNQYRLNEKFLIK